MYTNEKQTAEHEIIMTLLSSSPFFHRSVSTTLQG